MIVKNYQSHERELFFPHPTACIQKSMFPTRLLLFAMEYVLLVTLGQLSPEVFMDVLFQVFAASDRQVCGNSQQGESGCGSFGL